MSSEDVRNTSKENVVEEVDEEGEVFRLYTPKLHEQFKRNREALRQKIKAAQEQQIVMREKMDDGEIVYEADSGDNEEGDLDADYMFEEYDGRDPSLEEGNILPIRLGLVPRKILQKPAVEIDRFINAKFEVLFLLSLFYIIY